jgi:hypothetical protein
MNFFAVIIVVAILVIAFVLSLKYLSRRTARKEFGLHDRETWQRKWQEIENLSKGGESYLKLAIIECDQLLDHIFKAMRIPGEDTGQRLKFIVQTKPSLGYIYQARRLRNRLVHEANFRMNVSETRRAVGLYKKIFKDLGVL